MLNMFVKQFLIHNIIKNGSLQEVVASLPSQTKMHSPIWNVIFSSTAPFSHGGWPGESDGEVREANRRGVDTENGADSGEAYRYASLLEQLRNRVHLTGSQTDDAAIVTGLDV